LRSPEIVSNGLLFVNAKMTSVRANITLVKDASRQQLELFVFQSAQQTGANLGGCGNLVQRDAARLALPPQAFTERARASFALFK